MFVKTKICTDMKRFCIVTLFTLICFIGFGQTYSSTRYEITNFNGRDTSVVVNREVVLQVLLNGERNDIMKIYGLNYQYLSVKYGGNEDIYRIWDDHNDGFRKFRGEAVDTKDYIDFEIHKNEIEPFLILRVTTRRGETIKETKYYL